MYEKSIDQRNEFICFCQMYGTFEKTMTLLETFHNVNDIRDSKESIRQSSEK